MTETEFNKLNTGAEKKVLPFWRRDRGRSSASPGILSSTIQSLWVPESGMQASKLAKYSAWFIPVFYALLLLMVSPLHDRFDEWGGVMQYFAGKEILAGNGYSGWTSYFWPPLYSLLIGVGSLVAPGFFVGKAISVIAGAGLLCVTHELAMEITNQKKVALLTQVFLVLTPLYFKESLIAHNHMLDAFLFVSGMWLFLKALNGPTPGKLFIAGLVCGLAGLSRFTSYVLLALPLFLFMVLSVGFRRATQLAIAFWVGFVLVSLPWWYSNTATNGSPFYTRQELNICMEVVPGVWGGGSLIGLWQCNSSYTFGGVLDVIAAYPVEYLRNFGRNLISVSETLVKLPPNLLALFVIPAVLESFVLLRPRFWIVLFGELGLFVVLTSQAFVPEYAMLPWLPLLTILSVTFLFVYFDRVEARYAAAKKYHARSLSILLLVIIGISITPSTVSRINDPNATTGLVDLHEVTSALKAHDPDIETKVVMSVDPARAYYAGSKYLTTPVVYEGTVNGMLSYEGLSERVKTYAPKYPSNMPNSELRADYLVYTRTPEGISRWAPQDLPQFSFLLDPGSDQIPEPFELVYSSEDVVVYEIHWDVE